MKIHQRVKIFARVVALNKLMTNKKRWRRRLAHNAACGRCAQDEEGSLHSIRDCKWAREVWECLLPSELEGVFFSLDIQSLLVWMMKMGRRMDGASMWAEKMMRVCWQQWG